MSQRDFKMAAGFVSSAIAHVRQARALTVKLRGCPLSRPSIVCQRSHVIFSLAAVDTLTRRLAGTLYASLSIERCRMRTRANQCKEEMSVSA